MRRAILLIFPLILAGCGLPPAVTIASYALEGISFLSTGKSVGDHALSVVAQRDCAMLRVVKDELVTAGGSAPGIDRIVMMLSDEQNIREVTLFPMTQNAQDLMMQAPAPVPLERLEELHLRPLPPKAKGS